MDGVAEHAPGSAAPASAAPVPVTVLTGFLGSGKTTLLARLLREPGLRDTAVIVNELGEVGLDHLLVQSPVDETVLLDNGCLCCALRGDLAATLQRLLVRRVEGDLPPFGRVVIETTGMADPVPILQTLVADAELRPWFRLDGVVTVLDAYNGARQLDTHYEAVKQIAIADRVLLSKPDLVDAATIAGLESRVRALNPGVPVETVAHGAVDATRLVGPGPDPRADRGADVEAWLGEVARDAVEAIHGDGTHCGADDGVGAHAHHAHADAVQTFSVRRRGVIHPAGLALWLDLLSVFQGPGLLRVKGIVNVEGRPVVVNAVQHVCHPPVALDAWSGSDRDTRIVFITRGLDRRAVESTLDALDFRPAPAPGARRIDPAGYRRFTAVLERFRGEGR